MTIVIGHYHLHPGGVTKIIDSQVKSLRQNHTDDELKVICGHADEELIQSYKKENISVIINNDLNYLAEGLPKQELDNKYQRLKSFFISQLSENSILHFHNVNLGKNPLVSYCLYELAKGGYNVFNHAHDFAEDRPENMEFIRNIIENKFEKNMQEVLYPFDLHNYKYGVINSFDKERLIENGISSKRIVLLPNPVGIPEDAEKLNTEACSKQIRRTFNIDDSKKIVTYPVRVIRRKNIGELILLSELFRDQAVFLVTLAPKNPLEIKPYEEWKSFCIEHNLDNILFEVAGEIDFDPLIKGSDFCITTSLREGFGMTFMEPWLYKTPVIGRNIDYIVRDFHALGLSFPNNYDQLIIPNENQDFKVLNESEQKRQILRVVNDEKEKERFFSENEQLKSLLSSIDNETIEHNRKIIIKNYSFENYGKKLLDTYQGFFGSGRSTASA